MSAAGGSIRFFHLPILGWIKNGNGPSQADFIFLGLYGMLRSSEFKVARLCCALLDSAVKLATAQGFGPSCLYVYVF